VDVNVMARRALKDEMPGMMLRGVTRAIAKGVMQEQLEKQGGVFGAVLGAVASAATEQADDRMWRMLPGRVYVGRGYLPPGEHKMVVNGRDFGTVKVDGQYALVPLRLYESTVVAGDVGVMGQLATAQAMPAAKTETTTATTVETRTQTKSVKTQTKTQSRSSSATSSTVRASGATTAVK
jgi:uncharacterized protein